MLEGEEKWAVKRVTAPNRNVKGTLRASREKSLCDEIKSKITVLTDRNDDKDSSATGAAGGTDSEVTVKN